jgi:hypothetical protein
MAIRLDIEIWVIGKGGTQKGSGKQGRWMGEYVWGLLGFVALVHVGCISVVVVEGVCVRDCRGSGLYTVGIGQSAGGECVGGRGTVLIGWRHVGRETEDGGKSE